MNEEKQSDWPKIAAWCFGIWSLMVPLSASIIVSYQSTTIQNQERIRNEIAAFRAEVLTLNATNAERISVIATKQVDVMRRLDVVEREHESNAK